MSKSAIREGEEQFLTALRSLNKEQTEAVETINGPVMVIAGPGTGKTQILTLRIANIIQKTDTKPEDILALTFTDSGAKAMRSRLRQFLGAAAYRVNIHTFHSFAGLLLAEYPDAFPAIIGGSLMSDIEAVNAVREIVHNPNITKLRPVGNPDYYVTPLIRQIGELKKENILPDDLSAIIATQEDSLQGIEQFHQSGSHKGKQRGEYTKLEGVIVKNRELLLVYREYEALLRSNQQYDFNDMITETVRALSSNQEMKLDLQERFLYILADEHQDVNGAQNAILTLLTDHDDHPNLFVVGDEKQAIFRFQGASLENFLFFQDHYAKTKVISLTKNYRSTQEILDTSHHLVAVEDGPLKTLRIPLEAQSTEKKPEVRSFAHQSIEESWLIDDIKAKIEAGVPPEEIAVIVRTNQEVEHITSELRRQHLTVKPSADSDILEHPITRTILNYIQVLAEPQHEEALAKLLINGSAIPVTDAATILRARSGTATLENILSTPKILTSLNLENQQVVEDFYRALTKARQINSLTSPPETIAHFLRDTGFIYHTEATYPVEGGRVIRRLYDEIETLVRSGVATDIVSLHQAFKQRQQFGLPLTAPFIPTNESAIHVMTAHKSKGLEFQVVYLPHLTDKQWGIKKTRTNFQLPLYGTVAESELEDDEIRLLYVAMTRAKTDLCLSYANTSIDGNEQLPSRYLAGYESDLLESIDTSNITNSYNPLTRVKKTPDEVLSGELLQTMFRAQGFSATSINNYVENPWNYLFKSLLRIPEVQGLPLRYGTTIHNILDWYSKKRDDSPSESDVLKRLEYELNRQLLTTVEYTDLHEKGTAALIAYLPHLKQSLTAKTVTELSINVEFELPSDAVATIPLKGKLDRLDLTEAGELVRVVDYKTGKVRTRNMITGNTKEGKKDYLRQLEFYALLLAQYDHDAYHTDTFVLSFVEPNAKGEIKEEEFTLTTADTAELQEIIIAASNTIITGEFLTDHELAETSIYPDLATRLLLER